MKEPNMPYVTQGYSKAKAYCLWLHSRQPSNYQKAALRKNAGLLEIWFKIGDGIETRVWSWSVFAPLISQYYGVFNYTASNSGHIVSNRPVIKRFMTWKGCEIKWLWPDEKYYCTVCTKRMTNQEFKRPW